MKSEASSSTGEFDWNISKQDDLPIQYWRIETSGMDGGLVKRPAPPAPPHSGTNAAVLSMEVADFDSTAKAILSGGGREALPKFAVPGRCWQGYFIDTEGNTFGVFAVGLDAG